MAICINYRECPYGAYEECCKDETQNRCKHLEDYFLQQEPIKLEEKQYEHSN